MKLKTKIVTGFFLLISLPCLILGVLSYHQTAASLQEAGETQLHTAATEMALALETSMDSAEILAYTAANDSVLIEAVISGSGDSARPVLQSLQQQNPEFLDGIFIINQEGIIIASSQTNAASVSVKDRDYFKQGIAGQQVTSEVLASKTNNKRVIIIPKPIKKNGQIVGVLAASVNFDYMMRKIDNIKVGDTGYGYMLNNAGQFIYHPNKELVLKDSLLQSRAQGVADLAKQMVTGQTGQGFYMDQGTQMQVAYAPVKQFSLAVIMSVKEYMAPAQRILYNTALILVIALAIALSIAYLLANSIVKPIARLRVLMQNAEHGNLAISGASDRKDEVGDLFRSFDAMLVGQAGVVKNVRVSGEKLLDSSMKMLGSTQQVSEAGALITCNMQSVAEESHMGNEILQKTSRVLSALVNLIQVVKTKVDMAEEQAFVTRQAGERGRNKVDETVACMKDIQVETQRTSVVADELNRHSQQAGRILEMITALASQTNLLALNASIEAARAGEHGRGFSIVAEEVRKLAEQSNAGAQEISVLIHKITEKTNDVVEATQQNSKQVERGVCAAQEANESLQQIVDAVSQTVATVEEINELADQELASSDQIVSHVEQLLSLMEKVAASSQSVAAAMEEQTASMEIVESSATKNKQMADQLQTLVSRFEVK